MNELAFLRKEDLPERPAPARGTSADPALDITPILGDWQNADNGESGGIVRMVVTERDGRAWVRAYGAATPGPREWDEVEAIAYAPNVESRAAWAFTSIHDFGFLETTIVAYVKLGVLVTTTYNAFRDGSGRADYWTREFFHR